MYAWGLVPLSIYEWLNLLKATTASTRYKDITSCGYILLEISLHIFFSYSQHVFHSNHLFPTGFTLGAVYLKGWQGVWCWLSKRNSCVTFPHPGVVDGHQAPGSHLLPSAENILKSNIGQRRSCVKRGTSILTIAKELDFFFFFGQPIQVD